MKIQSIDVSSDRFLSGLRQLDRALSLTERQVGSGRRLEIPSDDPDSVSLLLQVRTEMARLDQNASNLQRVTTEVDAAENALQTTARLLDRVRTLATQGGSGFTGAETRQGLADEVGDILQRLAALANTQADGRYIFSGDSDQQPPYVWDDLADPPWGAYLGSAADRRVEHPTGSLIAVASDAGFIFTNADDSKNVLLQVRAVYTALMNNDDAAVRDLSDELGAVSNHVNSSLTFYGNIQERVREARNTGAQMKLRLDSVRSGIEDADLATAIVSMQHLQFQREAALQIRGSFPNRSLFDYLG